MLLVAAPPSTRSSVSGMPESAAIASSRSATWYAMLSRAARAMCAAVVPRVTPTFVPRAEAGDCRHAAHAAVVWGGGRERFDRRRRAHEAEAVANPLHDGAADDDAPLERVLRAPADLPRHGGHEPLLRARRLRADVLEQEAAGAVGVLRHAGPLAHLPEERRLLIARKARNRHALDAERRRRGRVHLARRSYERQHALRHVEDPQQLVVPLQRVNVEQHRPRRVADVGDVCRVVGQLPDEPGVDGAERELAGRRPRAGARHVVEQPADLARGEIGVDEQAGFCLNRFAGAAGLQPFAVVRRAAILPDDRVVDRLAGLAVPDDRRLALVRDADRGHVFRPHARASERFDGDADLRRPDLLRIVLDPAGVRKNLPELLLRDAADRTVAIEHDGARARGALIESEDERHGRRLYNAPMSKGLMRELCAEFFGT